MIEQVRNLRQSTIAKCLQMHTFNTKAPGKTVSAPKVGVKQPERCQIKEEAGTSPKLEHQKESRRSNRHSGQELKQQFHLVLEMKDEAGLDSEQKCNNQGEANVPSHRVKLSTPFRDLY